jgi:hypothetical protein
VLLGLRFDKFHALSLKALRQIVPHMERGLRYDEAVAQIPAYGHHSQRVVLGTGTRRYLPSFYKDERSKQGSMVFRDDIDVPRNPVVLRALNQARKVVNAVIKKHGSLSACQPCTLKWRAICRGPWMSGAKSKNCRKSLETATTKPVKALNPTTAIAQRASFF